MSPHWTKWSVVPTLGKKKRHAATETCGRWDHALINFQLRLGGHFTFNAVGFDSPSCIDERLQGLAGETKKGPGLEKRLVQSGWSSGLTLAQLSGLALEMG